MKKINKQLIRENVFQQIRRKILSGEFKSGEKLNEKNLADQLGVSRTPVREALHKLELEGLIEIFPRKYCVVIGLTLECIHEIHLIRAALEPVAASQAVDHLTEEDLENLTSLLEKSAVYADEKNIDGLMDINDEFHRIINHASQLPRLIKMIDNMHDYIESFRYSFMKRAELVLRSIDEHAAILQALKKRDKDLVHKLVHEHLIGVTEYENVVLTDKELKADE